MSCDCRQEAVRTYPLAGDRVVRVIIRNSITPEDPYLNLARAQALSIRTGEAFDANRVPRIIKDNLIKTNISI